MQINYSNSDFENKFLVDSQAEVSLIKISSLSDDSIINTNEIINIVGVTDGSVKSLGTIYTTIFIGNTEIEIELVVVPHNFPIPVDGIIGKDFLKSHKCSINYHTNKFIIRHRGRPFEIPIIDQSQEDKHYHISPK